MEHENRKSNKVRV